MKRFLMLGWVLVLSVTALAAPLRLYFIDVEGGQSTLVVSPTGASLLIDAGWPGYDGRDANRILEVVKFVGIT